MKKRRRGLYRHGNIIKLLIIPTLFQVGLANADGNYACPDGYRSHAVTGSIVTQSVSEHDQEGFARLVLQPDDGDDEQAYRGLVVGTIVGLNAGLPVLDHQFDLFHSGEGIVSFRTRGDTVIAYKPLRDCGQGLYMAKVTESVTEFEALEGSLAGAEGEVMAKGILNKRCVGKNIFTLSGTICLP